MPLPRPRPRRLAPALTAALAPAVAAALVARPAPAQPAPLAGLDAYVAQAVRDWRVPGLAIVVVKDTAVAFMKGYGVRELGKPDPVGVHTRFGNMSTTKAFTAMLVAMLADSGRVRFDDAADGARHDWSAEMRAMYRAIADSAAARRREREARRVAGTRPTLPLARCAGTYADSLFGLAVVGQEARGLTLRLGESEGTLEHWNYDVFRVRWSDPFEGTDLVSFALDADGGVGELRVVGGPQRFRRAAAAAGR